MERCPQHDLVVHDDGRCVLCRRNEQQASQRQVVRVLAAMLAGLAVLVVAFALSDDAADPSVASAIALVADPPAAAQPDPETERPVSAATRPATNRTVTKGTAAQLPEPAPESELAQELVEPNAPVVAAIEPPARRLRLVRINILQPAPQPIYFARGPNQPFGTGRLAPQRQLRHHTGRYQNGQINTPRHARGRISRGTGRRAPARLR